MLSSTAPPVCCTGGPSTASPRCPCAAPGFDLFQRVQRFRCATVGPRETPGPAQPRLWGGPAEARSMAEGLSRRTVLHGLTAAAVAAGSLPWVASSASAVPGKSAPAAIDWAAYGRAVGSAFDRMENVGG